MNSTYHSPYSQRRDKNISSSATRAKSQIENWAQNALYESHGSPPRFPSPSPPNLRSPPRSRTTTDVSQDTTHKTVVLEKEVLNLQERVAALAALYGTSLVTHTSPPFVGSSSPSRRHASPSPVSLKNSYSSTTVRGGVRDAQVQTTVILQQQQQVVYSPSHDTYTLTPYNPPTVTSAVQVQQQYQLVAPTEQTPLPLEDERERFRKETLLLRAQLNVAKNERDLLQHELNNFKGGTTSSSIPPPPPPSTADSVETLKKRIQTLEQELSLATKRHEEVKSELQVISKAANEQEKSLRQHIQSLESQLQSAAMKSNTNLPSQEDILKKLQQWELNLKAAQDIHAEREASQDKEIKSLQQKLSTVQQSRLEAESQVTRLESIVFALRSQNETLQAQVKGQPQSSSSPPPPINTTTAMPTTPTSNAVVSSPRDKSPSHANHHTEKSPPPTVGRVPGPTPAIPDVSGAAADHCSRCWITFDPRNQPKEICTTCHKGFCRSCMAPNVKGVCSPCVFQASFKTASGGGNGGNRNTSHHGHHNNSHRSHHHDNDDDEEWEEVPNAELSAVHNPISSPKSQSASPNPVK
eukprot:PhF_6_TR5210/c0_g1_i1/m.7510